MFIINKIVEHSQVETIRKMTTASSIVEKANTGFGKVLVLGDEDEFVRIGETIVHRNEILESRPQHKFANPGPLGLFGFALSAFVLSLLNLGARGVHTSNVLAGLALFYGGLAQLLAGMWEFARGNTFAATAFSSYAAYWMSYGAILIPAFGITSAYKDPSELNNALGFFELAWFVFTTLITLLCIRSTVPFFIMFVATDVMYLLLGIGYLTEHSGFTKAGGWVGLVAAFLAWYNAFAGIASKEICYFDLPSFPMPGSGRRR
jgi:succinate-acetate transporter protein